MRPIKLKMSAFGAYVKPIELDFVTGLDGENFFLIHGATGSGKTTILDAISFALYGKTSGGSRTGEMMRSEQAAPTDKTEVEFTFTLRGKIYRVVRNPKYLRASKRGTGLTEEKASAEIFENGNRVEAKDVSSYVENLLKFSHEQFRQVIMLPQGAFQKFLLARSDEKQKVLNMLFDAEFFKRVEEDLKSRAATAKNLFERLTERRKNLLADADGAEENLSALTEKISAQLSAAQAQVKTLEVQVSDAQKNFGDAENLAKLFETFAAKKQTLTEAQKLHEEISAELATAKTEFDTRTAEEDRRKELERLTAELATKKSALKNLQAARKKLDEAQLAATKSAAAVEDFIKYKKSCDDLMVTLKAEVERLKDAPAKKISAEKTLQEAQARAKLTEAIDELRKKIFLARKTLATKNSAHEAAEQKLSELRSAQSDGSAALLAKNLRDGVPCPVCGAIHHPTPAMSEKIIPTAAQIKTAERETKSLLDEKISAENFLAKLNGELKTQEKSLAENLQTATVAEAQAAFDKISADVKALDAYNVRIKNGEIKIRDTEQKLSAARDADKESDRVVENLRGNVDEMTRLIDEKYSANPTLLDEEISSTTQELNRLNAAFKRAQDNFNRLNRNFAAQSATVAAALKARDEIAAQVEGKTLPDVPALKKIFDDARANWKAAVEAKADLSTKLKTLNDVAKKLDALNDELVVAEKKFLMWKTLSDAASGKISKISFQRYYLATMFGEVITEANNRLEKMSNGRYNFQRKEDVTDRRYSGGLDLEVVDDYTGTARPVETLSGGESFLASLSLALGLAAVVQNNAGGIKLDTIFIDEGFGSLDAETLDFALKTLMDLQSGGRLVGIISHVEELKNQMPVRLEVTSGKTGSTAEFKHGSARD